MKAFDRGKKKKKTPANMGTNLGPGKREPPSELWIGAACAA